MISAESIEKMLDSIYDGIMILDVDTGRYVYVNQRACELYNCDKDQVKDLLPADLSLGIHPYDEVAISTYSEKAIKEGKQVFEWQAKKLSGETFWAEVALSYAHLFDKVYFIAVVRDISYRKKIEAEKNKTMAQFKAILDSSPDALAIVSQDGVFLGGNQSFLKRWDKKPEEIIGHSALEILPKDIFDSRMERAREVINSKEPVQFIDTYDNKWFEIHISPVIEPDGSVSTVAMTSRNITENKLASDKLRKEHDHLADILESISDAFIALDKKWVCTAMNHRAEEIFGDVPKNITGKNIWQSFPHSDSGDLQKSCEKVMKQHIPLSIENLFPSTGRWYECRIFPTETGVSVFFHDITAEKNAEKLVQESELRYSAIFENTGTAAVIIEEDTIISLANTKFEELSGFSKEEIEHKKSWKEFVVWEDLTRMEEQHIKRRINKEAAMKSYEFRFVDKYGNEKYIFLTVDIIPGTTRSVASLLDISEMKKAENKLRESEASYRLLFEHNPLPMLIYERGTLKMISVNEAFLKLYGYRADQIPEMLLTDLYPEEQKTPITQLAEEIQGHSYAGEWRHLKADGLFIDILATSHDIIYENKKARIVVINDITQRKKIELEVLRSEMKLKEAQQVAKLGNWELDLITDNLFWSEEVYSIFELDNNTFDASYDAFLNAIHPEDKDFVNKEFQKAIKSKKPYETEHRLLMPDGRIKYVIEKGFIDYNTKGNPIRSVGTVQDITERKMFELELQRNRMLLRSMIDSLPMWLAAVDPEGNYFIANQYYSKTFGIPLDQIENHNFREFFKPELYKKHKAILEKCVKSGKVAEVSDEVEFEKGQITHIYGAYTPLKDSDGKIFGVSAAVMDISKQKNIEEEIIKLNQTLEEKVNQRTLLLEKANMELMIEISERTRAEEFIKRQLAEKEVLLKEIHHRVKNNMQVIISILNLQLSTINDENISRILRDSQARIKTMALIHEKLYETKDFSNIDLLDYIKNLFEFLSSIYKSPSENIRYSISGDQVQVDIDSIIAVGLITNEIITNSYKYAFCDRKDGKIEIRLNRKDEKHLVYKIKDNGIGFPEGFDYRNAQSLGLQLVCILTEQIQGTLEVISSPKGTEFVIVFPSKL